MTVPSKSKLEDFLASSRGADALSVGGWILSPLVDPPPQHAKNDGHLDPVGASSSS